jgi:succinyl-diaminopimelate desuccinylase
MKKNSLLILTLLGMSCLILSGKVNAYPGKPSKNVQSDIKTAEAAEARGLDVGALMGLMAIPSVSSDISANNQAVLYLKKWFDERGVYTAVCTNDVGRTVLYASALPGKKHDIVFVTHIDVVPASEEDQFQPKIKDGFLYGRGACDTKGNAFVIAQVLANLAGKKSVAAVFATDEENRPAGLDTPTVLLNNGYIPQKFIIVGDTNGEFQDSLTIAEKGHAVVKIIVHGRGGHSSMPWAADNPIPKLMDAYQKVKEAFPKPANPNDHWCEYLTPTRLFGSSAGNIIPDTAEMHLSYRFIRPDGREWIKEFLEKTTGLEVWVPESCRLPVISSPDNHFVRTLHEAMQKKWKERTVHLTKMSCATDATRYVHLNLPTVIFGATGFGTHAKQERVSLQSLVEYMEMFTEYLANLKY